VLIFFFIVFSCLAMIIVATLYRYYSINNILMSLDARCDSAFSDVDVHIKHRHNLLPGLVETVRGFVTHEKDIITQITDARLEANVSTMQTKVHSEKITNQTINSLLSLAEKYPDLKASSHFNALREELIECENRITASRRFSNLAIEEYNATLKQFPGSQIAKLKRLSPRRSFDLGIERVLHDEPVAIKF
jgi:LemA protein